MYVSWKRAFVFCACLLFVGCATTPDLYVWGGYESMIYNMYEKPGSETPSEQVSKVVQTIQEAEQSGKRVAPGMYAHLGYLYALLGDSKSSRMAFDAEKRLFPESAHWVDGMLQRAEEAMKARGQKDV